MSYYRVIYHLVWGTKHRLPLITEKIQTYLYQTMISKIQDMGGFVYAIGGVEDHIHIILSIPAKIAIKEFVRKLKGSSSYHVNKKLGTPGQFQWQAGYGIFSIDPENKDGIIQYVKHQKEHHDDRSLHPEFEIWDEPE